MNWYYVLNGAQAGPVDENQLDELVRTQVIAAETLVWKEGMANWEPYRAARSSRPAFPGLATDGPAAATLAAGAYQGIPAAPAYQGIPAAGAYQGIPAAGGRACAQCGLIFPETEVVSLAGVYVCAGCKPLALQRMREGSWMAGSRRYGGFWIRAAAYLLDILIVVVGYYIIAIPLGLGAVGVMGAMTDPTAMIGLGIAALAMSMAVGAAYQVYFLTKYGATPGKLVLGLKVIRGDGGPITAGRAFARMCAHALSGMILYIGYFMAGFDSEKRALHDHICDTRVVYK